MTMRYRRSFYDATRINKFSAAQIVPVLMSIVHPRSVVDLGCGVGSWLAVFAEHGVQDISGFDGPWVHNDDLLIPLSCFNRHNLCDPITVNRRYDLAISLEVAEHLPHDNAPILIDSLTRLSGIVLFAAAIPFQGGTNHINEQWPAYWIQLFSKRGYSVIDCLRTKFWDNDHVRWWYAQNMLLFVDERTLTDNTSLQYLHKRENLHGIPLVHPRRWEKQCDPRKLAFTNAVRQCLKILQANFLR